MEWRGQRDHVGVGGVLVRTDFFLPSFYRPLGPEVYPQAGLFEADYWISGHLELRKIPQIHVHGSQFWAPLASSWRDALHKSWSKKCTRKGSSHSKCAKLSQLELALVMIASFYSIRFTRR